MNANAKHPPATLSIIIPFHNEHAILDQCLKRLAHATRALNLTIELIMVDDGSSDGSTEWLQRHAPRFAWTFRLLRLSRNFGKEAALTAGLDHASGDAVVIMDADLQDPPEELPRMVETWQQGVDVVLMKRRDRQADPLFRRVSARLFYRLLQVSSDVDIPPDVGDFRLLSRRAVSALRYLSERNRYMKGLFAWIGMPTTVLEYTREPRCGGQTQWDVIKLLQLAMDGITSFSISPLRWATGTGLIAATLGGAFGLWIVLKALLFSTTPPGYPSLIAIITFLGGVQLMAIGLLGEYVGKTYMESKQRPVYLLESELDLRPCSHISGNERSLPLS